MTIQCIVDIFTRICTPNVNISLEALSIEKIVSSSWKKRMLCFSLNNMQWYAWQQKEDNTYKEMWQHTCYEKSSSYAISYSWANKVTPSAQTKPWNRCQRQVKESDFLSYDDIKYCTYHKHKGHDITECSHLMDSLITAFNKGMMKARIHPNTMKHKKQWNKVQNRSWQKSQNSLEMICQSILLLIL